jgi:hypothetical protein
MCHCYAWGKHLIGDLENGKIYQMSSTVYADAGTPIRRMRQAPVVSNAGGVLFHKALTLEMETGVGLTTGQGSDPQIMMQFSDDCGRTWSSERWAALGKIGEYARRVIFRRLGRSRNRVYKVEVTDPVSVAFADADLEVEQGTN